jgi:predicted nuclease of predicted toxin-antitoxin system
MRFLGDMGISGTTIRILRLDGHDAFHLRERGLQRLPDAEIWELARRESRIVLTFDLDFAEIAATAGEPLPSIIIFRLADQTPVFVTDRLQNVLQDCQADLQAGAIVSVEETRHRVRLLPIRRV